MEMELKSFVLSPQNLLMFERWAGEAELGEIVEATATAYIVDHRAPDWVEAIPAQMS